MPVSMAIVCLIIGLTRPVRWKALECIDRTAQTPSIFATSNTGSSLGPEWLWNRRVRSVQRWETASRPPLDGWRDKSVADNAATEGRAVVAQHNVEWSFPNREPIFDRYASWLFSSHVNRQRTVRVEMRF